jgi:hypothetical protein
LEKKDRKKEFFDDGRVIADMSVDGMPSSLLSRRKSKKLKEKKNEHEIELTFRERASVFLGVISGYLLFGLIVFGGFALFILFCIKVWFK